MKGWQDLVMSGFQQSCKSPEHTLLRNVLIRGIADAVKVSKNDKGSGHERTARAWMLLEREISESDIRYSAKKAFGFIWVCDHLELDWEEVRSQVERLIQIGEVPSVYMRRAKGS